MREAGLVNRGFHLISDVLPFGGLWYLEMPDAIEYAEHRGRAHDAVISVYDPVGNVTRRTSTRASSKKRERDA